MTDLAETTDPELSKVQRWRADELTGRGMEEWQAVWLALDGPYKWAEARDLIESGCPPFLAFDIVR